MSNPMTTAGADITKTKFVEGDGVGVGSESVDVSFPESPGESVGESVGGSVGATVGVTYAAVLQGPMALASGTNKIK